MACPHLAEDGTALTVANDGTYGSDWNGAELRLTLMRSPAYAADTWEDKLAVARDRFVPRQDTASGRSGSGSPAAPVTDRMERIGREALVHNEIPYALAYFRRAERSVRKRGSPSKARPSRSRPSRGPRTGGTPSSGCSSRPGRRGGSRSGFRPSA